MEAEIEEHTGEAEHTGRREEDTVPGRHPGKDRAYQLLLHSLPSATHIWDSGKPQPGPACRLRVGQALVLHAV